MVGIGPEGQEGTPDERWPVSDSVALALAKSGEVQRLTRQPQASKERRSPIGNSLTWLSANATAPDADTTPSYVAVLDGGDLGPRSPGVGQLNNSGLVAENRDA